MMENEIKKICQYFDLFSDNMITVHYDLGPWSGPILNIEGMGSFFGTFYETKDILFPCTP